MTVGAWMRRPALLKAGRVAGYVAFGLAAFLVGVVLTFPTNRLRSYLEARLSQGPATVRIDRVSVRGLGSLALYGVHVELPPEVAAQGAPGDAAPTPVKRAMVLDEVDVSVGLFRLLLGTLSVTATVQDGEGILGPIQIVQGKDTIQVDISQIKDFPIPADLPVFGVRMTGRLNGRATATYDLKEGLAASTGHLELTATLVRALKPTLKSDGGPISLTDVDLGKVTLDVFLDKRSSLAAFKAERRAPGSDGQVLQFEKAEIDGADVKLVTDKNSTIRLFSGKGLGEGQLALDASFALNDPFFDRTVNVNGDPQTPNRFLRTLLSMGPAWKNALSGSYYGISCTGTLSHPACVPKKPSVRGGDFKMPAKDADASAAATGPATAPAAAPKAMPTIPRPAEPARPPAVLNPTGTLPVVAPSPAAVPARPAGEEVPGELRPAPVRADANPAAIPALRPGVLPMQPTVIGRPRLRVRDEEAPEQGPPPIEGAAPAAPAPPQE